MIRLLRKSGVIVGAEEYYSDDAKYLPVSIRDIYETDEYRYEHISATAFPEKPQKKSLAEVLEKAYSSSYIEDCWDKASKAALEHILEGKIPEVKKILDDPECTSQSFCAYKILKRLRELSE